MLLIDASNLKWGGGLGLLIHLTNVLYEKKLPFVVLQDPILNRYKLKGQLENVNVTIFNRKKILRKFIKIYKPKSVFFFGNYPPNFKCPNIRTFVSFQNIHLLDCSDNSKFSWKEQLTWKLKKIYLNFHRQNADYYIVPTSFVQNEFFKTYKISKDRTPVIPFYEANTMLKWKEEFETAKIKKIDNSFIYNSSPHPHKNHLNLLKAWKIITDKGYYPELKLTLPIGDNRVENFQHRIDELRNKGAKIININKNGFLSYEEILKEIYLCSFTIFPSLNETFGFGQVEGALLGNKVLSSNRPHVYPVITPSITFDPESPIDIAEKIIKSMTSDIPLPKLHFHDEIEKLISFLYKK